VPEHVMSWQPPPAALHLRSTQAYAMDTHITQGELSVLLYCLESMEVDFKEEGDATVDFESVFEKLERLADQTPNPSQLDQNVLTVLLNSWSWTKSHSIAIVIHPTLGLRLTSSGSLHTLVLTGVNTFQCSATKQTRLSFLKKTEIGMSFKSLSVITTI